MNDLKKALILVALLLLTSCASSQGGVLVCSVDGVESFRSPNAHYWIQDEQNWRSIEPASSYEQKRGEYCYISTPSNGVN